MDKLCSFMLPDLAYEERQRQSMSWSSTSYALVLTQQGTAVDNAYVAAM